MLKTVYALVAGGLVLSFCIGALMKFGATGPLHVAQAEDDPRIARAFVRAVTALCRVPRHLQP